MSHKDFGCVLALRSSLELSRRFFRSMKFFAILKIPLVQEEGLNDAYPPQQSAGQNRRIFC
ncbi:unnamed protein product [Moneuplotes crassus]|uniref:Uncharacterized protein n=1 Tax=Euplotes crassus TaxID=5936 RepID=A0AAD1UFB7_EUPCR|nr:unnamed protein product [Moneuplotes crassus]